MKKKTNIKPSIFETNLNIVYSHLDKEDYDSAIFYLNKILAVNPNRSYITYLKIKTLISLNRYLEAKDLISLAKRKWPNKKKFEEQRIFLIQNDISNKDITKTSNHTNRLIQKIGIIYRIPIKSNKKNIWSDGFTKAIDILSTDYSFKYFNIVDDKPTKEELEELDFLLIKANWNSKVESYIRTEIGELNTRKGLMISGVGIPPPVNDMLYYDVLWFETFWYKKFIISHPNIFHGFGIDTTIMKRKEISKDYDWLSIGGLLPHKRYHLFSKKEGRKIVLGDSSYELSKPIIENLIKEEVEIKDYVSYELLSDFINRSKKVYIPATIKGGGERAVLEARSCGVDVEIESDNPKLDELLKSPIWDERYYAQQLKKGFQSIELGRNSFLSKKTVEIKSTKNIKAGYKSFHNGNFVIKGTQTITIGNYCAFGSNISIITENHDYNYACLLGLFYKQHFNTDHPGALKNPPNISRTKGKVEIGHDVWIGDNVTILSGVSIGNGVCIGTGSIITKDIPAYTIVAGIPHKTIKKRFSIEVIAFLQSIQWWYWSDKKIRNNKEFFLMDLNEVEIKNINIY